MPGIGWQDGIFTIKTILYTRQNHSLSTYVDFVDLVKESDTVNHDLLIDILERYGDPPKTLILHCQNLHKNQSCT